ncbi:hypothetical protein OGAPHI_002713 [Ogataea philodendri]|uniref:Uncharacterized protein n=1 Tax=Ogataea philodendri TaxID=1378263 RepID=A0A9P8T7A7_9ASCO|nr:uncharacterized protein OGAPHI_002713 [Ogataea philodendri]KAH3668958.1 hypothetical protein OGAPHI_002713 [Ogataea philodendri]
MSSIWSLNASLSSSLSKMAKAPALLRGSINPSGLVTLEPITLTSLAWKIAKEIRHLKFLGNVWSILACSNRKSVCMDGGRPKFEAQNWSAKNTASQVLVLHFSASGRATCVLENSLMNFPLWRPNWKDKFFASPTNLYEQSSSTFWLGSGHVPRIRSA